MTTSIKTKAPKLELLAATWPLRRNADFWGDASYGGTSGCTSMWISLRLFDDDSFLAYQNREAVRDIGLWIWMSKEGGLSLEFRAHEVYSATADTLRRMLGFINKLTKRIPPRKPDQHAADYVIDTLKACGIKRAVQYQGIGVPDEHVELDLLRGTLRAEIDRRVANISG